MEGFVCLEKIEKLETFTHGDIKLKEFVLEGIDPFPGYYCDTPQNYDNQKPKYVFVGLKQGRACYEDEILRAFFSIRGKVSYSFEANFGRFLVFNKFKPCVRIKVKDFIHVPEIIELLKNAGVQFEPYEKFPASETHIKVRKYNTFVEITKGVYTGDDPDHYYIKVPVHLKWDDFETLIHSVKNSMDFGLFDAAQTSLYLKNEIVEFVRIYTKSFKKNDFACLKDEILKRMS
jgi:hypothetical protein